MTDKLAHSVSENQTSQTSFRKSHGTQSSLVAILEKRKRALDKGEYLSALFMDLSIIQCLLYHDT